MTPIAFNLTPRLKACLPSGRDYSTLLALYEALQEAAVFEMASAPDIKATEAVADPDGWIEWENGDGKPDLPNKTKILWRDKDGDEFCSGVGDLGWGANLESTLRCYRVVKP